MVTARRMAELGNITPCVPVEGFEAETDARRGSGVHRKILRAFENLRAAGVLYGISITVTRQSKGPVLSRLFVDYYFRDHGVYYGWMQRSNGCMSAGRKGGYLSVDWNGDVTPRWRRCATFATATAATATAWWSTDRRSAI
jgi:hypothetical protein